MECRDVRDMAESFVSGQLDRATTDDLLRHLEGCPTCRDDVEALRALRTSVRGAFDRADDLKASPEFLARLDDTLRTASGTVRPAPETSGSADLTDAGARGTRPSFGRWRWLAAAAVLLVTLGTLAFWSHDWIAGGDPLEGAAVGDHRDCAVAFALDEKPITLEEAAQRYDPVYRVLETFPASDLPTESGPAHVVARHACVYKGRRFAHVVLKYRGTLVSLLVTSENTSNKPELTPSEQAQVPAAARRLATTSVVSWRASRYMIFLVGDLDEADLARLAQAAAQPLSSRLAGV